MDSDEDGHRTGNAREALDMYCDHRDGPCIVCADAFKEIFDSTPSAGVCLNKWLAYCRLHEFLLKWLYVWRFWGPAVERSESLINRFHRLRLCNPRCFAGDDFPCYERRYLRRLGVDDSVTEPAAVVNRVYFKLNEFHRLLHDRRVYHAMFERGKISYLYCREMPCLQITNLTDYVSFDDEKAAERLQKAPQWPHIESRFADAFIVGEAVAGLWDPAREPADLHLHLYTARNCSDEMREECIGDPLHDRCSDSGLSCAVYELTFNLTIHHVCGLRFEHREDLVHHVMLQQPTDATRKAVCVATCKFYTMTLGGGGEGSRGTPSKLQTLCHLKLLEPQLTFLRTNLARAPVSDSEFVLIPNN
uniref:Orf-23 protein n=1 Tax=Lymantria dispar multicapsid nuclear polyhedrosis virus TaxID=10449 RepID=A0A0D3QVN6_NPVLD|nr:orf-23 protein [Lymantria dispar multiple nucleopolyhedrovirus]AMO27527.1 hypothetical protein [Lymantria dispar multiple nucleopolyhedrovirus]